jgi:hypothetical protein
MRTSNYSFVADISNDNLPKCITNIEIRKNNSGNVKIESCIDESKSYTLAKTESGLYEFKNNNKIDAGYYFLNFYNADGSISSTYLILISEKSNNYTISFQ